MANRRKPILTKLNVDQNTHALNVESLVNSDIPRCFTYVLGAVELSGGVDYWDSFSTLSSPIVLGIGTTVFFMMYLLNTNKPP